MVPAHIAQGLFNVLQILTRLTHLVTASSANLCNRSSVSKSDSIHPSLAPSLKSSKTVCCPKKIKFLCRINNVTDEFLLCLTDPCPRNNQMEMAIEVKARRVYRPRHCRFRFVQTDAIWDRSSCELGSRQSGSAITCDRLRGHGSHHFGALCADERTSALHPARHLREQRAVLLCRGGPS